MDVDHPVINKDDTNPMNNPWDFWHPNPFRAWNADRTSRHEVKNVTNIEDYYFDERHWSLPRRSQRLRIQRRLRREDKAAADESASGPIRPKLTSGRVNPYSISVETKKKMQLPKKTLQTMLRPAITANYPEEAWPCYVCRRPLGHPHCSLDCWRRLYETNFSNVLDNEIELRETPGMGVGVFVAPGVTIPAGTALGIYAGELVRSDDEEKWTSRYLFSVADKKGFYVDAATFGNWTRFVNSHCNPNIDATPFNIGGMVFVTYVTKRTLKEGEQLFIEYGPDYFLGLNFQCGCSAQPEPHWPVQVR
ncbi:hypothetical protein OQA88_7156 [Cercophora sp. LCS_1]